MVLSWSPDFKLLTRALVARVPGEALSNVSIRLADAGERSTRAAIVLGTRRFSSSSTNSRRFRADRVRGWVRECGDMTCSCTKFGPRDNQTIRVTGGGRPCASVLREVDLRLWYNERLSPPARKPSAGAAEAGEDVA